MSEDTRDPPPPKEGEVTKTQAEDEEGEVLEVGEIVTTTGSSFSAEPKPFDSSNPASSSKDQEKILSSKISGSQV